MSFLKIALPFSSEFLVGTCMEAKCDHEQAQKFTSLELYIPHFHQIHTMLSAWSQCAEPEPIGTAGIRPRGRDGRDRAGDYRGYKNIVVCGEGLRGVATDGRY